MPTTNGSLDPLPGPELVFGLVGPIGIDLKLVSRVLSQELRRVGYSAHELHLTDALKSFSSGFKLKEAPLEARYHSYIDAGNKLRQRLERHDAFALLAVAAIRNKRLELTRRRNQPAIRTAYILNQFKRPEEIETLRSVYGRGFIQISAYSSRRVRQDCLAELIAKSHHKDRRQDAYRGKAIELILRDEAEEGNEYGQRVRDAFPLADVVINAATQETIRETCQRFVEALFGNTFITPSRDEYGTYLARAIALRSADLSRQVGAVIMDTSGDVIAFGCNEVPKAEGGAYWEGDQYDLRDFRLGHDPSVRVKQEILGDLLRRLKEGKWLSAKMSKLDVSALISDALHGKNAVCRDAPLMDILEFGRVVHAEMHALAAAARSGLGVSGATLYCTTFPCHICARHVVAAGIRRVVYVEPYAKSQAAELYPDSIEVDGDSRLEGPKVQFQPFVGIGAYRYSDIFSKKSRKDADGNVLRWTPSSAEPVLRRLVPSYVLIESTLLKSLSERFDTVGLSLKRSDRPRRRLGANKHQRSRRTKRPHARLKKHRTRRGPPRARP